MKIKELEIIKNSIKRRYRNGPDNIGKDLVAPCLNNSVLYRRGTGFFSSGALVGYAAAMEHLIKENVKIQIICSPVVHDNELVKILENNITKEQKQKTIQKLADSIVLKAVGYTLDNKRRDYKNSLLAYMIAKEIIEIRFAIPYNFEGIKNDSSEDLTNNLYHVKTGYFQLTDGSIVGFDGSFNESDSGHQHHIEQTQVWRSWKEEDKERMLDVIDDVNNDWEGNNPYVKIFKLSSEAIGIIKNIAPQTRPSKSSQKTNQSSSLRYYQIEALEAWKKNEFNGIIALATGTGKTKTAIAAIKNFKITRKNGLVIVAAPYVPLANQWIKELNAQGISTVEVYDIKDNWRSKVNNIIDMHNLNKEEKVEIPVLVCVNKTFKSEIFQKILERIQGAEKNQFIVIDECHHYNKNEHIDKLPKNIIYRLGLSATPYEPNQPQILEKYFNKIVYEYSIGKAIEEDYLCPYEYHPIFIEFSQIEARKYIDIVKKIQNSNKQIEYEEDYENSESENIGVKELDRLLETVASKLTVLEQELEKTGIKPLTLFYCGEGYVEINNVKTRQIDTLTRLLYGLNWKVSKITSLENRNERQKTLLAFKSQQIDAVASMRVLDEGIDVPDCRQAYILASQRLVRQGVQRRGRILRKSENKNLAKLYDFIITGPKLSVNELEKLYSRELERAKLFAKDAVNKNDCLKKLQGV
jgi:superfamily II DNA or RNA helicase